MRNGAKKLSPSIFGIALICFFLPFIEVSCEGQKIATFIGIQLVTGTRIERPAAFGGGEQVQRVEGEPLAILALFSAIVGLGLSFLKGKKSSIAPAIIGAAGLILLLVLKIKLDSNILKEGQGMLQLKYGIGFWLTFLFFLFAAGLNAFLFSQRDKAQGG